MSANEKIGTAELSTYGLKLSKFDGHHNLPAFKEILQPNDLSEEMKKLKEQNIKVVLVGRYSTSANRTAGINSFKAKVQTEVIHRWKFTAHDFESDCVLRKGISVSLYPHNIALLTFELTVIPLIP